MKKSLSLLTLSILVFILPIHAQFKVPPQKEQGYVQDYENLLTTQQKADLDTQIYSINKKSSIEIAVIILNDLQSHDIAEAALEIGRKWGVGHKDMNNGIVYLISPKNHQARIEVGYGLEGDLPDITAKNIGDDVVHFYKNGQWFEGIKQAVTEIGNQLNPVFREQQKINEANQQTKNKDIIKTIELVFLLIILIIIIIFLLNKEILGEKNEEMSEENDDEKNEENEEVSNQFTNAATATAIAASAGNFFNPSKKSSDDDKDDDDDESSSSSFNNDDDDDSSSSSSFGGFDGGSFGGGGATSSW